MLAFLPVLFFAQVWVYLYRRSGQLDLRGSMLKSLLVLAATVTAGTEALSVFTALNARNASLFWALANLAAGAGLVRTFGFSLEAPVSTLRRAASELGSFTAARETTVYLSIAGVSCTVVFATALYAAPNTVDSMTYHMARVAHWVQQGSVEHYPTSILRQLYNSPFAEYAILQMQLLAGSDTYANLVQFAAFLGCGVAVSLVCKEFGLDRKMQALSVVLVSTIPMAIVQATGTQNDLVVSVFTLCFFLFYYRFALSGLWEDCIYGGLALGLALLSKGTALPFCFAVGLVVFGVYFFGKATAAERIRFAARSSLMAAIGFVIFAPVLIRNFNTFGAPLTTAEEKLANANVTPAIVASNLYRNYAIHLATLVEPANVALEDLGRQIFGEELDNPASSCLSIKFGVEFSMHEDVAGNLLHLLLITLCLPVVLFSRRAAERKALAVNVLVVILGFFFYCLIVRWQPWASRLHTPLFMLAMPFAAAGLMRLGTRATAFATLLCTIGALPYLLAGEPRSVFPAGFDSVFTTARSQQYFANKSSLAEVYHEAAAILKERGATEVGLYFSNETFYDFGDWDYAMWVSLKEDFAAGPEIRHVGVENVSANLRGKLPPTEWVFATKPGTVIEGANYIEVWKNGTARLLHRADLEAPSSHPELPQD